MRLVVKFIVTMDWLANRLDRLGETGRALLTGSKGHTVEYMKYVSAKLLSWMDRAWKSIPRIYFTLSFSS